MKQEIELELQGLRGDFQLSLSLRAPARGVTVVFGRSGSGKTTLLRAVAGLERLGGRVVVGAATWQDQERDVFVEPWLRRVGYVFQDSLLFPHLSVAENLEFGRRRAVSPAPETGFTQVVEGLSLAPLLSRRPDALSGGERQRVAIGRALLSNPVLLMMDEPLSALDLGARAQILGLLEKLRGELSVPLLYVTHSVDEAARLADRVAWLDKGRVRVVAAPEVVFARVDVGTELGDEASGLIRARVSRHDGDYELTELESAFGPLFTHRLDVERGRTVLLRARARDVSIALEREAKSSIMNVFSSTVVDLAPLTSGEVLVRLASTRDPEQTLLARVMRKSAEDLGLRPGLPVFARVKGVTLR
jgi:molybdate transport system ATP-binding protein